MKKLFTTIAAVSLMVMAYVVCSGFSPNHQDWRGSTSAYVKQKSTWKVTEDTLSAKKNLLKKENLKAGVDSAKIQIDKAKYVIRELTQKERLDSAKSKMRQAWHRANRKSPVEPQE